MRREEFIGDVVRHTTGGVVHCDANPESGNVNYGPHNCTGQITAGDNIIIAYMRNHERGDDDWLQQFRFCGNCEDAREFSDEARKIGREQVVVEGVLEHFEGIVEGNFYEDAVRLRDVDVFDYSPETQGMV